MDAMTLTDDPTLLQQAPHLLAIFVVAFLLGSIPWGLIISKVFFRKDIREYGSGNIGTTNAMRSLGKVGGGAVFLLDFGKGLLATIVGLIIYYWWLASLAAGTFLISGENISVVFLLTALDGMSSVSAVIPEPTIQNILATAFVACTLGHIFSPWLKFKGGKGIAVAIGCVLLAYSWLGFVLELAIFIVLVLLTRRVSIGSIAAAAACPAFALWLFWGNLYAICACTIVGVAVIWAHRGNIKRLREGTEPRIGEKKELGKRSGAQAQSAGQQRGDKKKPSNSNKRSAQAQAVKTHDTQRQKSKTSDPGQRGSNKQKSKGQKK